MTVEKEKAKEIIKKSRGCKDVAIEKCSTQKCKDCEFYYPVNEYEELLHWIEYVTSSAIKYLENSHIFKDDDMELIKMFFRI